MSHLRAQEPGSPLSERTAADRASINLFDAYGLPLAGLIALERLYSVVKVGAVQYAYTDHALFTRALGQIWSAGLVPEPLPNTLGADLPRVAPRLRGVDVDLGELRVADVSGPPRRFS